MLTLFVVLLPLVLLSAGRSHPGRRDVRKSMQISKRSNLTDAFRCTDTQIPASSFPGNTPPHQIAKRSRSWLSRMRGRPSSMVSVPIEDMGVGGWTTMISIRNKFSLRSTTFKVLIDISDTDLWVFSSKCKDPRFVDRKKYVPKNIRKPKTFEIEYIGDSRIDGTVHSSMVAFGSVKLGKQYFGAATTVTDDHPYDGIVGLSFDTTSEFEGHTSFLRNVIQRCKISPMFAIYPAGRNSKLHLGGIDQNAFTGPIDYHNVMENAPIWVLGNAHITVQGATPHTYRAYSTIISSVSKFINGPAETVEEIYKVLGGERMSNVWTFPCDKEPKVSISWGIRRNDWEIQGFNLGHMGPNAQKCLGAIQEGVLHDWVINPIFLRGVYTIFDLGGMQVGFAKLKK